MIGTLPLNTLHNHYVCVCTAAFLFIIIFIHMIFKNEFFTSFVPKCSPVSYACKHPITNCRIIISPKFKT